MLILTSVACLMAYAVELRESGQRQREFASNHECVIIYHHELKDDPVTALPESQIRDIYKGRLPTKHQWPGPAWIRSHLGDEAFASIAQAYLFSPRDEEVSTAKFECPGNLKLLHITGWFELSKLEGLENLQQLETIRINCCGNLKDYSPLNELQQLRHAELSRCDSMTEIPFKNLRNLEVLSISQAPRLAGYSELASLPGLKTLTLNRVGSLDFSSLGHNSISSLTIRMCSSSNASGFSKFQSLKNLTILACPIADVAELGNLEKLETLTITSSYSIEDFSPLGKLDNLKVLCLPRNPGLRDLEFAKNLSSLETLSVAECNNLTNWDAVFSLKQLKLLDVTLCSKIKGQDVEELRKRLPNTEIKYYFQ